MLFQDFKSTGIMQGLWIILTEFLILSRFVNGIQKCKVLNCGYNLCVMECPASGSAYFNIQYIANLDAVVECVNNPKSSSFHYDIRSTIQKVKSLTLKNCGFGDATEIGRIGRLIGAENTTVLVIFNEASIFQEVGSSLSLKKVNFQGFSDVKILIIAEYALGNISNDLLEPMPLLTELSLVRTSIKSIPRNFLQPVPNLKNLNLNRNKIRRFEIDAFKNLTKLEILNLAQNEIRELHKNIFDDLISLRKLLLRGNDLMTLPQDLLKKLNNLKTVDLSENPFQKLPVDLLPNSQNLHSVEFFLARNLKSVPSGLFGKFYQLSCVHITGSKIQNLPENLFQESVELEVIDLSRNALRTLPERIFEDLWKLKRLQLNGNEIEYLPDTIFEPCIVLDELYLQSNRIVSISNLLFRDLYNLRYLFLANNKITHIGETAFSNLCKIKEINLYRNNLMKLDFQFLIFYYCDLMPNLLHRHRLKPPGSYRNFDLPHHSKTVLMEEDPISNSSLDFNIDLSNNNIKAIDLGGEFEHILLQKKVKSVSLNIQNNPLQCDCQMYNLVRYLDTSLNRTILEKFLIRVGSIKCSSPKELKGVPLTDLVSKDYRCMASEAEKYDNFTLCPKACTYWKRPYDRTLIFDCSYKNLTEAPETLCNLDNGEYLIELNLTGNFLNSIPNLHENGYENVKTLLVSGNRIRRIRKDIISPTLKMLQLHDNNITTIPVEILGSMNRSLTRVTLGGNPWECTCDTVQFKYFIEKSNSPVIDVENIVCVDSKKLVKTLLLIELCPSKTNILVGFSLLIAILGLVVGILLAVYYRYQREIKVWLYANRICLWFVAEEELDKDKPYDAFISYSHMDEDFVIHELVKNLETGPKTFKLCIHIRDWLVGEWIPTQIANSVKNSKRTIVVVSPNFMQSEWGKLEFRTAHCQALKEGRARVIVILYGDIGPIEKLEPELRTHLKMNTYVKWGDPWFWDKLRYALPHKTSLER